MKIIINLRDDKSKEIVFNNMQYLLDAAEETGHCLVAYNNKEKTNAFVEKTKTGYKISAYSKETEV